MHPEYIFGIHAATTTLQRDSKRVKGMWVLKGRVDARMQKLLDLAAEKSIRVEWTGRKELDELAENGVHHHITVESGRRLKNLHKQQQTMIHGRELDHA